VRTKIYAKNSKNTGESHTGLRILMILTVKATNGVDWVLKKMLAPKDRRVIQKLNVGKEQNVMNNIFVGYSKMLAPNNEQRQ
jgi:hypothetical protein